MLRCARRTWTAVAATVGAVAPPASAQAPDTARVRDSAAVELPPVEVVATILPVAGPTIGSGVPARVSSIAGRDLDAWERRTLADALAAVAGVALYDDLGSPYKLTLSTRGFHVGPVVGLPPGVSVFLDGVRQNEADAAQVNFDLLPLEHVKRVELLSGAGSLLGANSLGGAINLITRRGAGPAEAEVEVSGGSFATASVEGSVAGAGRGWDYYVGGGYERADGWREATGAESYNGFINLGRLNALRGLSLQVFGARSRAETAGSLPESILRTAPRSNFTAGDFEDLDLVQVSVAGYAPLGPGRGSLTVFHRRHSAERFNVNQVPDPDVRGFSRTWTVGANLDWRWTAPVGRGLFALRVGADGAANAVNIRLVEEAGGIGQLTTDVDSPSWDLAGYVLADLQLGRITLSGGFRYDAIRIPFEDNLDPAADTTSTFRRLSPRGGVSVELGAGAVVYASVGQSFRAPAVVELACADETAACPLPFALGDDPPLDPVVATTYEVGARWTRGATSVSAALHRSEVDDDIFFIASDAARFEGFFANIGRTRREGLELGIRTLLAGRHPLYANYAYTSATFRTAAEIFSPRSEGNFASSPFFGDNAVTPGSRLPLIPAHVVRGGAAVVHPTGLEAGVEARYTGTQWLRGDEANEIKPLGAYVTADVRAAWEGRGWGVSGVLSNAFNARRAVFGTYNENRETGELERFLTPLERVAFRLTLRRTFGGR